MCIAYIKVKSFTFLLVLEAKELNKDLTFAEFMHIQYFKPLVWKQEKTKLNIILLNLSPSLHTMLAIQHIS